MNYINRYFNLFELLVVLAIFSILASLIMPSLENIYHSGKTMQCKNNLKNTYTAMNLYMGDYSNQLPGPCQFIGAVPLFILDNKKNPYFGFNNRLGFFLKDYTTITKLNTTRLGTWAYNEELTCPENMELEIPAPLWRRHYTFPWTGSHPSDWLEGPSSKISKRYVFGYQKDRLLYNPWYFNFIEHPSELIALKDNISNVIRAPSYPIHTGSTRNNLFFDGRVEGTIPKGF